MKLRYLFSMILASVLLFSGCAQEEYATSFDNIKLDKTFLVLPVDGGTVELKINATESWAFDTTYTKDVWPNVIARNNDKSVKSCKPSWLSVDKFAGDAGETVVTFSAEAVPGGRELELCIKAGANSQFVKVRQGSLEAVSATCKDVIEGPDGKTYRVKGTVTSIVNTTYGNWYLKDDTGEVYIYGTLDKDGKTKNFASLGLEVGDVVEVEGPKTTYGTTVELVDVTVLSIEKALLKIVTPDAAVEAAGAELPITIAYKGQGVFPSISEDAQDWISIVSTETKFGEPTKIEPNPADTAIFTVRVAEFTEYVPKRTGSILFTSSMKDDEGKTLSTETPFTITQSGLVIPTIAEVIAAGPAASAKTQGVIVAKYQRGALISDGTAYMLVYKNAVMEEAVGDKIEVVGSTTLYGGMLQFAASGLVVTKLSEGNPVVHPTPTVLDGAGMDAQLAKTAVEYIEYTGTLSVSGNYYNVAIEGAATAQGSLSYIDATAFPNAVNGAKVKVRGYFIGTSSNKFVNTMTVAVLDPNAAPEEPEVPATVTLTNAEIVAAMTSTETSYVDYTIESASGVWTVNAQQLKGNTYLQCRGHKGSYIKTPAFEKDIKSVTIHFSTAKDVYKDNTYCVFPGTWVPDTVENKVAYSADGNVGTAVTDGTYSLTIPVNAGNKQVCISMIGAYSYYLDHIDVAF